jgi:hypothetical protein
VFGQVDEVEQLVDASRVRVRAVVEPERDVLSDGEVREQREVLEDDSDVALLRRDERAVAGDGLVAERNLSLGRFL